MRLLGDPASVSWWARYTPWSYLGAFFIVTGAFAGAWALTHSSR